MAALDRKASARRTKPVSHLWRALRGLVLVLLRGRLFRRRQSPTVRSADILSHPSGRYLAESAQPFAGGDQQGATHKGADRDIPKKRHRVRRRSAARAGWQAGTGLVW